MASTDNGGRFMEAPSINSLSRTGSQTISVRTSASPVGNKSSNNANRSGPNAISTASKSLAFASNRSPVTGSGVDETPQAGNSHYSINNSSSGGNNTTSTNNNASTPSGKQSTATGQGLHNSLLRVGPRLRAEGLMVPPASDAATLRRQVAGLQSDLQAHIESEQRLQNINQQLRERLELYMKQNHENVERAENELNTLHEEMEQTLELQRRLAQRWLDGLYVQRLKQESKENALQQRRYSLCSTAMKCWYAYLQMRNHKKISVTLAFQHYLRSLQRQIARSLLQMWWEQTAKKRRALQLEQLLGARRRHSLLVISLHCWMHSTFDNLLVANAKFHNDLLEVKLKESMRQVYTQTKAALQRANHEGVDTSYNTSSSLKVQAKPSVHWDATASDDQQGHESPDEEMPSPKNPIGLMEESSYSNLLEKTTQSVSDKNDSDGSSIVVNSLQSYNAPAQDPLQANWESSFALYSHNGPNKSSHSLNDLELERTSEGNGPTKQMSDSTFTVAEESPVAVENLQAEIQRLQARIMSRLRDSPTQCEVSITKMSCKSDA